MKWIESIFNDRYYRTKPFERDGNIYEKIGIKRFQKVLLRIAMKRRHEVPFRYYFITDNSIDGLAAFEKRTRKSERAHVFIALVIFAYQLRIMIFLDGVGDVLFLLFFTVLNVITNLYPICLQRYNRIRMNRVMQKRQKRGSRPV